MQGSQRRLSKQSLSTWNENRTATESNRAFASQKWQIRAQASEAQKIVDIAVADGAKQIENVEWSVKDPAQLEAKAYAAALRRTKELAEQSASQTGLKLGEIISIDSSAGDCRL